MIWNKDKLTKNNFKSDIVWINSFLGSGTLYFAKIKTLKNINDGEIWHISGMYVLFPTNQIMN